VLLAEPRLVASRPSNGKYSGALVAELRIGSAHGLFAQLEHPIHDAWIRKKMVEARLMMT
jgi:hypothetical protein